MPERLVHQQRIGRHSAVFDTGDIGQPLVVDTTSLNRFGDIHVVVYHVKNKLHRCVDNRFAAGASRGKNRLAVFRNNCRCHARQHTLLWCYEVWRSADGATCVRHTRHCIEVTHFVVEKVTAASNNNCRAIAVFKRVGHADHVAVFIYHREMRRFFTLVRFGKLRWVANIRLRHVDCRTLLRRIVFVHETSNWHCFIKIGVA